MISGALSQFNTEIWLRERKLSGKNCGIWIKRWYCGFADLKRSILYVSTCSLHPRKSPADLREEANVRAAFRARTVRRQRQANASWQFLQRSVSVQINLFLKGHLRLRAMFRGRGGPNLQHISLIGQFQLQVQISASTIYDPIRRRSMPIQFSFNLARTQWLFFLVKPCVRFGC